MKTMNKLIPALCMLLVSAILAGTSTYAWFSMNKTVTATGMQVTAKSNSTYLLISQTNGTIGGIRGEGVITQDLSVDATLFPAALEGTDPTAANKWYTAQGTDYDNGTLKDGSKVTFATVEEAVTGNYLVKKTVYIGLAANSAATGALTVTGTTFTDAIGGATKLIIAVGASIKGTMTAENKATPITIVDTIGVDDVITVDLYLFYDGNDEDIKSSNAASLTSASVDLTFAVADPTT